MSLAIDPNNFAAYNNMGLAFAQTEKIEKAIEYFEISGKINSEFPDPFVNLGSIFLAKGNFLFHDGKSSKANEYFNMAKENLENAYNIQPNAPDITYNLGAVYYVMGMHKEANDLLEKATKLSPNFPTPVYSEFLGRVVNPK